MVSPAEEMAIARVRQILHGIDIDELDSDDGWWETSDQVQRGAKALNEIEALVRELVKEN